MVQKNDGFVDDILDEIRYRNDVIVASDMIVMLELILKFICKLLGQLDWH